MLGGGIVPGSLILIGGEPGVGKSTLVLEMSRHLTKSGKVLYVSGEESSSQIGLRAGRMGVDSKNLYISGEQYVENISAMVEDLTPVCVFIDSIQTVQREIYPHSPGSITQLRESAGEFLILAKKTNIPIFLIGHITKEGTIAGPKLLEHLVDTVLYFEGDKLNHYRIIRGVKNRFGAVGDIALLEMEASGLKEVKDRHKIFLTEGIGERSASALTCILEGTRALGVEVQALVTKSGYSNARRMSEGLDSRRVILISAVIEKYIGIPLGECDVFTNLAGGLEVDEPAVDLAIAGAIISSYKDIPLPQGTALLGEIGLSGEIRPIGRIHSRLKELNGLGISKIMIPKANEKECKDLDLPGTSLEPISKLGELISIFNLR